MKNTQTIGGICRQLQEASKRAETLAMDIEMMEQGSPDTAEIFVGQLMDEAGHCQALVLKLTELLMEATDSDDGEPGTNADEDGGDGSVFAAGDLTAQKGEVEEPKEDGQ